MAGRAVFPFAAALLLLAAHAHALDDPVAGIEPVEDSDFHDDGAFPEAKVRLGQLLFFDKILSGNRNIACATCHHPRFATSDGLALSLGEGAVGVGPERHTVDEAPVLDREPRNSQALFFVGARELTALFRDGRVEVDRSGRWSSGFITPALQQLPRGLDSALAAQAMIPVTSSIEMAGQRGENPVATAADSSEPGNFTRAWALLARRLQAIPEYVALFKAAYPAIRAEDITMVHAANALAAFQAASFRADGSPFDAYLRTRDPAVLGPAAFRGMRLFYGADGPGCSGCHAGKFLSDQRFHAIAMPQIGAGRGDGNDDTYWRESGFLVRVEDRGRAAVTGRAADKYCFRTPSLRNVALTGPWGHAGAYRSLEAVIRHHLDPPAALEAYDPGQAELVPLVHVIERDTSATRDAYRVLTGERLEAFGLRDSWVQRTPSLRRAIAAYNELPRRHLSDGEIADLVAFLNALTDPASRALDHLIPARVPSGLPIDR